MFYRPSIALLSLLLILGFPWIPTGYSTEQWAWKDPLAAVLEPEPQPVNDPPLNFWPKRIMLSHRIGEQDQECVPFASNFTTLEIMFAADYQLGHIMPILDLQGHRFDNNTYSGNVGIGGRYVPRSSSRLCHLWGFNVFYDYRQGCIGHYHQIGAGAELLGRRWDYRANVYVPLGQTAFVRTCMFDHYQGGYWLSQTDVEQVAYSFNFEVGFSAIKGKNFLLYLAAGPYFIAGSECSGNNPGFEVRMRPQYRDYIFLDLGYRYDGIFGSIWQAEIALTLPIYQISRLNRYPCRISDRQIYQPIERFDTLPIDNETHWEWNY